MFELRFAAVLAVAMTCAATLALSQTTPPRQRPQGPGEDCNLSNFCGVPYEYVPAPESPSPALTGPARLAGSGAKLVNGVARQVGGQIGWGTVCYGSPLCAWGVGRGNIAHVEHKPDLGYTYSYPLNFPEGSTGGVSAVAMNSKGHIYAFLRNDPGKPMLFEWDENHKLVRSFGVDIAGKPHGMAVDAEDNLWICDQFGDTVLKLSPEGKVIPKGCNTCHTVLSQHEGTVAIASAPGAEFKHPVDLGDLTAVNCSDCHSGGVGP